MEPLNLNLRASDSHPLRPLTVWDTVPGIIIPNVVKGQLCNLRVDKPTGLNRESVKKKSDLKSQDRDQNTWAIKEKVPWK